MKPIEHDGKTVYVCVDIEASGPVPGLYNMVSIGGVAVRYDGTRHVPAETFYYELKPVCDGFDAHAMSIHGIPESYLREHGMPAADALKAIDEWLDTHLEDGEKPLFVGHNAPFDWMYVAWYFAWAGMKNPFGYNALDTKALLMGRHGLVWGSCNKEKLLELYPDLKAPKPEEVHNALADAVFQADILIALLDGQAPN